jgi:hypothetical protein
LDCLQQNIQTIRLNFRREDHNNDWPGSTKGCAQHSPASPFFERLLIVAVNRMFDKDAAASAHALRRSFLFGRE